MAKLRKEKEYHIQKIPYYQIIHPKQTASLCAYYTYNSNKLEKHCREMQCDGKTAYFCWTKDGK